MSRLRPLLQKDYLLKGTAKSGESIPVGKPGKYVAKSEAKKNQISVPHFDSTAWQKDSAGKILEIPEQRQDG